MEHAGGGHRTEALPLHRAARRQPERTERPAVERAEKRNQVRSPLVMTRQLDRGLVGFGAGVGEERSHAAVDRDDRRELFGQPDLGLVVEVRPRHVQEALGLIDDGLHDLGMRVTGRVDGDPGGAVEEPVAVHVLDDGALAAGHDERIATRVRRGHILRVTLDEATRVGPGERGADVGKHADT